MKYKVTIGLLVLLVSIFFVGCSSESFSIVGMWKDDGGTIRIFSDNGTCKNIAKVDIGGPAPVYSISEKVDSNGYYLLDVSQGGYNETKFYVKVISNDEIQIYETVGATKALYSLKRQGKTANDTSENSQSNTENSTAKPAESAVVPEAKTQTYFYDARDFSDDVAWVKRETSNWECIDLKGKTLFSLGSNSKPVSNFFFGAALIETRETNNTITNKIIDKSGLVIFPKDNNDQWAFETYYGKYYFVKRHINTFQKTEYQTGIVDSTGKWIIEPTPVLKVPRNINQAAGGPITFPYGLINVEYHDYKSYDANTNEFFSKGDWSDENELDFTRRLMEKLYVEDLIYLEYSDHLPQGGYKDRLVVPQDSFPGIYGVDLTKFGFRGVKTGFYDRNHNLVTGSLFNNGNRPIGSFSNGFCTVSVKNPQGSIFYTIIDKTGKMMFEPVSQRINPVFSGRAYVSGGDKGYYIDVNGKTVISDITYGSSFNEYGLARVGISSNSNKEIYFIDTNGKIAF